MALSSAANSPRTAVSSSRSRRSVTPLTAECTMRTCAPSAQRSAATRAILVQLASVATLVPPNLRTIQAGGLRVTDSVLRAWRGLAARGNASVRPEPGAWSEQRELRFYYIGKMACGHLPDIGFVAGRKRRDSCGLRCALRG